MKQNPVNLHEKLDLISEYWSPGIIAQMNNHQFKLAKIKGEFVWHSHEHTDEVFIVLDGEMSIMFRDRTVELKKGDLFVVPKEIEHKPVSENECRILLVEKEGTVNTGNVTHHLTQKEENKI